MKSNKADNNHHVCCPGLHLPAETKKAGHKDTASAAQKSDGVLKSQKDNVPRQNVAPKVHKGVSTRYGQQAELKEQNQHLMATNEELQKNLIDTQSLSTDLLHELKAFGDIASQQRARLDEIQTTMTDLTKAREHMMQERENFSLEAAEMEKALKDAEALLL
ncbi:hypothetical protein D9C73_009467 [Collichthys lucidus]|uniref:Uncharacterized protein n=1 Tax=Collichthys lucidus TaxID=240159 RepID=A0A4U5UPN7_COLLU|nr:hypothetical protein D9C73_009467 [Collichthys lucidus]